LRRSLSIFALLFAASQGPLAAQSTPEAVAQAYANAIKASDWAGAARVMHPDALKQLRGIFAPLVSGPAAAEVGGGLFGVATAAEFASLSDTVMFATFLRNMMAQAPAVATAIAGATITSIGHVNGGADTVFVVNRTEMSMEGVGVTQFEVLPFALYHGEWRALLKADLTNMGAMLRRATGTP